MTGSWLHSCHFQFWDFPGSVPAQPYQIFSLVSLSTCFISKYHSLVLTPLSLYKNIQSQGFEGDLGPTTTVPLWSFFPGSYPKAFDPVPSLSLCLWFCPCFCLSLSAYFCLSLSHSINIIWWFYCLYIKTRMRSSDSFSSYFLLIQNACISL